MLASSGLNAAHHDVRAGSGLRRSQDAEVAEQAKRRNYALRLVLDAGYVGRVFIEYEGKCVTKAD
ncbi:MAG: hypothetical protein AAF479_00290, partial [Pseudomonadota bacterium]